MKGKYYEILEQLEKFLKNKEITIEDKIRAKILKGKTLVYLAGFDFISDYNEKILDILNEAYVESNNIQNDLLAYDATYWKYLPLWFLNRYDEFLATNEKYHQLQEIIKNKHPSLLKLIEARSFVWKFFVDSIRGYHESSFVSTSLELIDFQLESLKIYLELENQEEIIFRLRQIAIVYSMRGLYDQSLEYWNKVLKIHLEVDNKYFIGNA
ncbi:MAG: hypothetical protein FK730_10140, partial [Asgard group archaeon]|nr:hypothetical protein [Asgard group archaeon]